MSGGGSQNYLKYLLEGVKPDEAMKTADDERELARKERENVTASNSTPLKKKKRESITPKSNEMPKRQQVSDIHTTRKTCSNRPKQCQRTKTHVGGSAAGKVPRRIECED